MSKPRAVLVDDDKQQLEEVSSTIADAGYELITFESVGEALNFLDTAETLIDLFVLDRKLPMRIGEKAVDELGDELFRIVTAGHPDARVIVFSGFTDFDHAQESMERTGFVFDDGKERIDRVSVVRKSQFDKFERFVRELRDLILRFDMIEISTTGAINEHQKRILRRVAYHYGASAISAQLLAGGLTGADVWRCEVVSPSGPIAAVVAKVGESFPTAGGLQDLLPRDSIARRVEVIRGLMGGSIISILQLAGTSTTSLMSLIASNDLEAARVVQSLRVGLDALERSQARSIPLRELVEQILDWNKLETELKSIGLVTPSPGLWVTTSMVMSHTDLHAANILVCDGSPVLIDSDENKFSSALRDPAVLLMSSWVHPDSPFHDADWPTIEWISGNFGDRMFARSSLSPAWCAEVLDWMDERSASPREYWAIVLAYGVRQLRFENVRSNADVNAKVVALVTLAHSRLIGD